MSDLNENCPTKIYLPNKKAGDKGTSQEPGPFEFYSSMGLNPTQINIIKTAAPKREYYFTHPEGNRLFNMNLGPVALAFVGRTGKADLARMEDLKLEYGEEWTKEWLVYCGVDYYRYCEA
jgi:type IV secretion system protein VirB4